MDKITTWFDVNYQRLVDNTNRITRNEEETYDILQECILSFLQQPEERQLDILGKGKVEHYITSCISIQFKSSTSPYHTKYRKKQRTEIEFVDWQHLDVEDDNEDRHQQCLECIMRELDNLHFYWATLVREKFINGLTYLELHEKYKISKNSLLRDVKEGLNMLKTKCGDYDEDMFKM